MVTRHASVSLGLSLAIAIVGAGALVPARARVEVDARVDRPDDPHRPMTTATRVPSPVPPPDLVLVAVGRGADCAAKLHTLTVRVKNAGESDAGPFVVASSDNRYLWDVLGLAVGAEVLLEQPIDWTGALSVTVTVDSDSEIAEADESNNVGSYDIPPSLPPPPECTATPTPTDTATPEPTATPTQKPAYLPLLSQGVAKEQIDVPPDHFLPRARARTLRLRQLDNRYPDRADAPDVELVIEPGDTQDESYLFVGSHPASPLSMRLWDSPLAKWLAASPPDAHYVFQAFGRPDPRAAVLAQRDRIRAALAGLSPAERDDWWRRLHFVTVDPMAVSGEDAAWWQRTLLDWGTSNPEASAAWTDAQGGAQSLAMDATADSGWARPITEQAPMRGELAAFGNLGCNGMQPAQSVAGKVAIVDRGTCTFVEKAVNAARLGAVGLVIVTDDRPKIAMAGSCAPCPRIPVVMIDEEPGVTLRDLALGGTAVQFEARSERAPAHALAIDGNGRLREFGSIPYGFDDSPMDLLEQVAYEAQAFAFEQRRDRGWRQVATGDLVIPVFKGVEASDPGWSGRRFIGNLDLPDAATLATYDTLEVELSLGCPYGIDRYCGDWDYLVQLYLCDDAAQPDRCDTEIVRWITPYKRAGHWVTDISPVLSYLKAGGRHRVGFWTVQKYVVDMSFKLSRKAGTGLAAVERVPLFGGGAFVADYNDKYRPITFTVPADVAKVELVTVITGHGFAGDTKSCAEFCNHTHHFTFNGHEVSVRHDNADESLPPSVFNYGCSNRVADGVVPNQFGTWPYARAGWCPGLDVPPLRVDITDKVKRGGEPNVVTYRGLYRGEPYVPELVAGQTSFDARIDMTSYLVYYAAP